MRRWAVCGGLLAVVLCGCTTGGGEPSADGAADRSVAGGGAGAAAAELAQPAAGPVRPIRQIGALRVQGVPDIPFELAERMRQYRNTRSAVLSGWLGNDLLISTRFGDTEQMHRVDEPSGARQQLTYFDEPVTEARIAPVADPGGFVFARDVGGSEFYQLFRFDLASGTSTLLTDGRSRNTDVVWAPDGQRFAYTTTQRNGTDWDIHLQDLDGNVTVALRSDGVGWVAQDVAADGQRLLVSQYVSINESYLYELSLEDGALTPLLDPTLRVAIRQARYTPDGTSVLLTSDVGAEFLRLHRLDLADRRLAVLTGDIAWDVEEFAMAPGGRYLAFTVNEGGYSRLHVWHWPDEAPVALPALLDGVISELMFHPDGERLGFSLSLPTAPTDVYSIDLGGRSLTRWTHSEAGGLNPARFTHPESISYPTFDTVDGERRRIPAFVYRPSGRGPHPVYLSIHGGPESQYRPYFSPALQYYVDELGMAVVVPNVRGSAGYGKSYLKLDNGRRREDSVRDIGALLDWIDSQPDLDSNRVVVSGGSYGGYMVLASLVHYSDRLAAGIERVGISNFVSFLSHTEGYRRELRRAEYGDERDPEMRAFLESISPLKHVERISRPLLITQGANDPRVPAAESAQMHEALVARGVPVWYVLALDEGHGFHRKSNSDYAAAATVLFLRRFLFHEEGSGE